MEGVLLRFWEETSKQDKLSHKSGNFIPEILTGPFLLKFRVVLIWGLMLGCFYLALIIHTMLLLYFIQFSKTIL